jgi:hypothetical protein
MAKDQQQQRQPEAPAPVTEKAKDPTICTTLVGGGLNCGGKLMIEEVPRAGRRCHLCKTFTADPA